MSEVLRAIMEYNCAYSQTAFYTLLLRQGLGGGARVLSRMQSSLLCKADCYFLAMGAAQSTALGGGTGVFGWNGKAAPTTFALQRGINQEQFEFTPQIKSNQNYNLNNFVSWGEYILFKPLELLTVIQDVMVNDGASPNTNTINYVVIQGIEYYMPSSAMGAGNGQ
jgi:hypothetical protein